MDSLRAAYEVSKKNDDSELAYAWFLYHRGDQSGATQIISRLPHIRFELDWENTDWGFSDVTFTIRVATAARAPRYVPEGSGSRD